MLSTKPRKTLRGKLVGIMLVMLSVVGVTTMIIVAWQQISASERDLRTKETQIRESLDAKGRLMTNNHALALRTAVLDNAFSDVKALVEGAVKDDDVVYGAFLTADGVPWVYATPHASKDEERPKDNVWKELGVEAAALRSARESERQVQLFGQAIREFSAPVMDGQDVLGTIRYGISTQRIESALASAREESWRSLRQSLLSLGAMFIGFTLVGLALVRRTAAKVTQPLGSLTAVTEEIALGDRSKRVQVQSGDEVELLATSFNRMVDDLDASYRDLQALNATLEQRVEERTAQLATRNKDMRLVLDNVEQGFVTVSRDGIMAIERSAVVDVWLGSYGENTLFWDYVEKVDPRFAAQFQLGIECIIEDFLPREVTIAQLPHRISTPRRQLEVSYVALNEGDTFAGLLIVIADITEKLALERNEREQAEVMAAFQRIMTDREGYFAFFREAENQVRLIVAGTLDDDQKRLKRTIHSLKGNSSLMGMNVVAAICHDMETSMEELVRPPSPSQVQELGKRWAELEQALSHFLREREEKNIIVARADYEKLVRDMLATGKSDVAEMLKEWELEPLDTQFDRIEEQVNNLAQGLNKGHVTFRRSGGEIRMDATHWSAFWADFVHIVRNAVDHGFWDEGKAPPDHPPPVFSISAKIVDGEFILECSDNGRGIDWEGVRKRASSMGLPSESEQDLIAALFADHLTTRTTATKTSGRGVGTSAVLARTQRMGGTIEVESKPGQGTCFRFRFPRWQLRRAANDAGVAKAVS